MTDSPRFTRILAEGIDELGGVRHVLLSHRDDVADADRWADRYGADVWIHTADADAAPYATGLFEGDEIVEVAPGVVTVPAPATPRGRSCSTSTISGCSPATPCTGTTVGASSTCSQGRCSIRGRRWPTRWTGWLRCGWNGCSPDTETGHNVGADLYAEQMARLGPAMREVGRDGWSDRPDSAYDWY